MNSRKILPYFLLGTSLTFLSVPSVAHTLPLCPPLPYGQQDSSLIALPPKTIEGWMANGLHYIILPNESPAHTVEMRLIMKLGSVQESDEQKGCAHFLEHMAFVGSEHFPNRNMIDYLEGLGMKFGRDINALTGYDRTVFMLTVPMVQTDKTILDSTLLVLRDWLTGIDFKPERVQKERGVILEELRTYQNDDVFYQLKIGNSRFKERMPLGSAEDIRNMKRNRLIDFYKKWYSPQLATIVIVGDINPFQTEQRLLSLFQDIPSKTIKHKPDYPLTYAKGVQLMEVNDSIQQNSVLDLIVPHPSIVGKDLQSTLQKERGRLTAYALERRLTARHLPCTVSDEWYLAGSNHFAISFSETDKTNLLKQVTRVAAEIREILSTGWNADEFKLLKQDFAESFSLHEEGRTSATYCDDFTDYVLQGDRYIHTAEELNRLKQGLLQTEMSYLQEQLHNILEQMRQQVLWTYRNHAGKEHQITREELTQAWLDADTLQIPDFVFTPDKPLLQSIKTPPCLLAELKSDSLNLVKKETYLKHTRITQVVLRNGIKLIFRPTPAGEKNVLLHFIGQGGLANIDPKLYHQYESTAGFMELGGVARIPYDTLSEYMVQSGLLLNISIEPFWHNLLGTVPADHSLELFNLIQEKLQRPELRYQDFEEIRKEELDNLGKSSLLNQLMKRAADRQLTNRMDALVGNALSTPIRPKQLHDIKAMNLDSIASYFKYLYHQVNGTTVILTGNYNLNQVKSQAIAVFGRIQPVAPQKQWSVTVPAFQFPTKKYTEGFHHDHETQTVLEYVYPGHFEPSLQNGLVLKLMRDLLQDRLLRELREKENIVYSPYTSLYYYGNPQNRYYFNLSLSVDTENSAKVDSLLRNIIGNLQENLVKESELDKLKRSFLVTKQQTLTESAAVSWRDILSALIKNGESLEDFESYQQQLDHITPTIIRQAFRTYLSEERSILLFLGKHQLYHSN